MNRLSSLASRWALPALALAMFLSKAPSSTAAPLPEGLLDGCSFTGCIVAYWSSDVGGNDHYYGFVPTTSATTWTSANSIALGSTLGGGSVGYLASVLSSREQLFILNELVPTGESKNQVWIGGVQAAGASSPSVGWQWSRPASVTPELWNYTNWSPNEPNDESGNFDERNLAMWVRFFQNSASQRGKWNDESDETSVAAAIVGMIFEWEGPDFEVPEPSTALLIGLGTAGLVGLRRRARR